MAKTPYPDNWYDIDVATYRRSVKLFAAVKNMLRVKMKLHADAQVQEGDIFLFNHFARFETFIPQFLIFEQTGAYSCAVAASEFFKPNTVLASYLQKVGAIPHDHPRIFALLAAHILRGHKVIIFPEGGMVKDHHVIDDQGQYSIYSRGTGVRRKQHTGAAVLAQGLDVFKRAIRHAYSTQNHQQLQRWQEQLQLDNLDMLLANAFKPTRIIPSNITFYPIRSSGNWLATGVELFTDNLNYRQAEELLVESNILLKNTDMDIRMGPALDVNHVSPWWLRGVLGYLTGVASLDDVFDLHLAPQNYKHRLLAWCLRTGAEAIRDQYMQMIYAQVTINLSHLAATLIMVCVKNQRMSISRQDFFTALYITVKRLQNNTTIYLHRSLLNPFDYSDLMNGTNKRFQQFIAIAKEANLLLEDEDNYQLLPKLLAEQDFDHIRLENPIVVYHNEAKPIVLVEDTLVYALSVCNGYDKRQLAAWYFDDELRDLSWERHAYRKRQYDDINRLETAVADAAPFLLTPEKANGLGVLLIHGLLASPAELRDYGNFLVHQGYTVMGVRLKGHGSSPYALRQQTWTDWYASVVRGLTLLIAHCPQVFVVGFSTGGALALMLASENRPEIIAVTAVAVPVEFANLVFTLVPLLHGANILVDWVSSYEGIRPFIENDSEHPLINYRHVPVRSLYELRQLIIAMSDRLPTITTPVLIVHADNDPVVAFDSAALIMDKLTTPQKQLAVIHSGHHGILMENHGGTWETIQAFLCHYSPQPINVCPTVSGD